MADVPVRFAGLRGTLAAFAVDLFAGRAGSLTDAPMCSGGYDRLGVYDGSAWRLGPASDYAGNANVLSLLVNGTSVIDSSRNVKGASLWSGGAIRVDGNGDITGRNQALTGWLTLNGATRPAWGANLAKTLQTSSATAVGVYSDAIGDGAELWANLYFDGVSYKAINAKTNALPTRMSVSNGSIVLYTSLTQPVADGTVSDVGMRWIVSKRGQTIQWATEPVTSGRYVKISDTTIGPSATAKKSLLDGGVAAGGFAAVTDPAGRWDAVGAHSTTILEGKVASAPNQALTFELYRNGSVAATLTLPARTYGSTATPWYLEIRQTVRVAGASGTVRIDMRARVTADNANAQSSVYQIDTTLAGADLVAASTWDVVCTIPNNSSNQITCHEATKVG